MKFVLCVAMLVAVGQMAQGAACLTANNWNFSATVTNGQSLGPPAPANDPCTAYGLQSGNFEVFINSGFPSATAFSINVNFPGNGMITFLERV